MPHKRVRRAPTVRSHKGRGKNSEDHVLVRPDVPLLLTVCGLIVFGLFMIASAGVIYGDFRFGDPYYFLKQQLIGVGLGAVVMTFFMFFDYRKLRYWSPFFFAATVILLLLVHLPGLGVEAYGAKRWIALGSFSFQPAEAVKLGMIIFIAAWCAGKGIKKLQDFSEGVVPFVIIVSVVGFLLLKQPDVGTLGITVLALGSIFFVAGARLWHIIALGAASLGALALLIATSSYRRERFFTFLDPSADPLGSSYQITQALIAIGSGGIFGAGVGHSRQKGLYLPEPVGDSIFAIIGEELGLIGGVLLLATFVFLGMRLYVIALRSQDVFGKLIVVGMGVWILGQALMNIAAISGMIPLTGIPLSFVSYGGTSILVMMAAMGIVLNISRHRGSSD